MIFRLGSAGQGTDEQRRTDAGADGGERLPGQRHNGNWSAEGLAFDERLTSLADLAVWVRRQGLVEAGYRPDRQDAGLLEALRALRASLRRLLLAPGAVAQADLEALNRARAMAASPPLVRRCGRLLLAPGARLDWLGARWRIRRANAC
ncbi:MAG: ABATE domain-containing protein [Tistlia sp.]|uniref:ABATE domain-containing protein n=1 Tax=Tistlia sp. TaxID=3057121 RepID=UPI0034A24C04